MMPLSCEIRKQLEIERCIVCKDKCTQGIADIKTHIHAKIRAEAEKEWQDIVKEMDRR